MRHYTIVFIFGPRGPIKERSDVNTTSVANKLVYNTVFNAFFLCEIFIVVGGEIF